MDTILDAALLLAVLLASVIIHENAHGVVALSLGDPTAKAAGRLTLNPIPHLDPVGSFILPLFIGVASGWQTTFGYARPVPISPQKLRGTDRWGFAVVALAGPVSNVLLGFVAITVGEAMGFPGGRTGQVILLAFSINIFLAAFNLIPIPPLDGSRLLRVILSDRGRQRLDQVEPYGFLIILLLITLLQEPFFRVVGWIESVIVRLLPL